MLRNNLAKIMLDKNIRQTAISKDTGIARSTISRISKNLSEMIDVETIDKLCLYLDVTPNEFFDFIPYTFSYNLYTEDFDCDINLDNYEQTFFFKGASFNFDFYLDVVYRNNKLGDYYFLGNIEDLNHDKKEITIGLHLKYEQQDKFNSIFEAIPLSFKNEVYENMSNVVISNFEDNLNNYFAELEGKMGEYYPNDLILEIPKFIMSYDINVQLFTDLPF